MPIRLVIVSILLAATSVPAADPLTQCCAERLRVAGVRERQMLACHARATNGGANVDPACLADAAGDLARDIARIDARRGCPDAGDAASVQSDFDRVVGTIVAALRPATTASACAARKMKVAGRFATSLARAEAQFAPYPPDHLDELNPIANALGARVHTAFAALDARPDCLTTGDADDIIRLVTIGLASGPFPPDGLLLTAFRLCPRCGDSVRGGGEQCDDFDAFSCNGPCNADCTCPSCGDGVKNQTSEVCDGADAAACEGLCLSDCTCPTPVCGNGVKEAGEECDGAALGACGSGCQPDCTCPPPVCGNGIVEEGEQCEGTSCSIDSVIVGCSTTCQCCDGGVCGILGCCDPRDFCISGPSGYGSCFPTSCSPTHPCPSGYTCTTSSSPPGDYCFGQNGSVCYSPLPGGGFFATGCVPPGVCGGGGRCCLPSGEGCSSGGSCCSGTCSGGMCS